VAAPPRIIVRNILIVAGIALAIYLVYLLRQPITWVLVAAFIAVAVSGPIDALERRIHRRGLSIALVYLVLVLIPLAILGLIGGTVVRQGTELVADLPRYVTEASDFVRQNPTFRNFEEDYDITGKLQEQAQTLPGRVGDAAGTLSGFGLALVNSIFAIVTILILSLFLVGSGRRWVDAAISLRPSNQQARLQRTADRIAQAVGGYVGGALAQAVIAGVTTYIVLLILGVPFAAPLAVVVALFDLIPLIGATIGAAVVGIVTLFTNFPVATIVWAIWSIIYQQVENTVIQPQIQKRAVNVPPFLVIVAVLFGSTLFGILGALLAVPVAASILVLVREFIRLRRYEPEPEPPPAAVVAPPVAGPA
jgi:predicted PurR-regulated permease PerM